MVRLSVCKEVIENCPVGFITGLAAVISSTEAEEN